MKNCPYNNGCVHRTKQGKCRISPVHGTCYTVVTVWNSGTRVRPAFIQSTKENNSSLSDSEDLGGNK